MPTTEIILSFWNQFRERAEALADADSADVPVYDELLDALHRVDEGLYLEFSISDEGNELIITADGNADRFAAAHAVVDAAPGMDGWEVFALKPAVGFPKTVRWEEQVIAIESVVFDPLSREGSSDLGLRVYVPGLDPAHTEDAGNALLRVLDHGLGEAQHAECIQHFEVHPLPGDVDPSDLIPLSELEAYIKWRAAHEDGETLEAPDSDH